MFRLVLDVVLCEDEYEATQKANFVLGRLMEVFEDLTDSGDFVEGMNAQVRLQKDEDRTPRNYLKKNENGHASTSKSKLFEFPVK